LKKKGQTAEADVVMSNVNTKVLMTSYGEDNTSQDKGWIFDSGSTVYTCSRK